MNFSFLDGDVPVRHPMVFIFLNLFVLLECPVMSMKLILGIKFSQQNFSDGALDSITFVKRFQNFVSGIMI